MIANGKCFWLLLCGRGGFPYSVVDDQVLVWGQGGEGTWIKPSPGLELPMLQVLDNVELEEVDWPWLCVEGDHGLESLVPVRVLRLRSREKEKVQCLEHLVRKRDVDNLVDQVLHVQWEKPGRCWGSL